MLNATAYKIVITILNCMCQAENPYSKVSVDKIRELLAKVYEIHVGRRWIFCILAMLTGWGLIKRYKRYWKKSSGLWRQKSSAIYFTAKLWKELALLGVGEAKKMKTKITNCWKKKKTLKAQKGARDDESWTPEKQADRERFDDLLAGVTKSIS